MAYKTYEIDRQKAAAHEGSYSVENKLQEYLKDKYSPEALQTPKAKEATKNLLKQVAKDYDLKVGIERDDMEYENLAQRAITKFLSNQQDNTSQGLNKNILDVLQNSPV